MPPDRFRTTLELQLAPMEIGHYYKGTPYGSAERPDGTTSLIKSGSRGLSELLDSRTERIYTSCDAFLLNVSLSLNADVEDTGVHLFLFYTD